MKSSSQGKMKATVAVKIIRADGTEEDLGVVSLSDAAASRIAAAVREEAPEAVQTVDAGDRNTAESEANQAETRRLAEEDAARYSYQEEG